MPTGKSILTSSPAPPLPLAASSGLQPSRKSLPTGGEQSQRTAEIIAEDERSSRGHAEVERSSRGRNIIVPLLVMLTSQESTRLGVDSRPFFSDSTRLDSWNWRVDSFFQKKNWKKEEFFNKNSWFFKNRAKKRTFRHIFLLMFFTWNLIGHFPHSAKKQTNNLFIEIFKKNIYSGVDSSTRLDSGLVPCWLDSTRLVRSGIVSITIHYIKVIKYLFRFVFLCFVFALNRGEKSRDAGDRAKNRSRRGQLYYYIMTELFDNRSRSITNSWINTH